VRIIGENHKVYNNYFENLRGTGYRAALCLVRGKENSALNEYFQVKNAFVAFNTIVNHPQAFHASPLPSIPFPFYGSA
jgi:poly(beta-D-mannuronate) lyase